MSRFGGKTSKEKTVFLAKSSFVCMYCFPLDFTEFRGLHDEKQPLSQLR